MMSVHVKICGVRAVEHALAAVEAGADFVGFVFAESRRRIAPAEAAAIARELSPDVARVGLFVNESVATIAEIAALVGLDYVQLCGDESPALCAQISTPVIRSLRVAGPETLAALPLYKDIVTLFQLDGFQPGQYGGTGHTFDWRLAREVTDQYRILLAGGLTPENVGEAVATAQPWGVDVSSGVETDGVKDVAKIQAFVKAAKGRPLSPLPLPPQRGERLITEIVPEKE